MAMLFASSIPMVGSPRKIVAQPRMMNVLTQLFKYSSKSAPSEAHTRATCATFSHDQLGFSSFKTTARRDRKTSFKLFAVDSELKSRTGMGSNAVAHDRFLV